jgi:AbrB family looped-hinge helix DNA binding protein
LCGVFNLLAYLLKRRPNECKKRLECVARSAGPNPRGLAWRLVNYYLWSKVVHMRNSMKSTLTERGQTVVPAQIRRQFHLSPADRLEWIVEGNLIRVLPVRKDAIAAFRGQGSGGTTKRLIEERKRERRSER